VEKKRKLKGNKEKDPIIEVKPLGSVTIIY
jgi:hypothetical protein